MAAKPDPLFPSASVGRAAGARLSQSNTSHESLSSHPLLSAQPNSSPEAHPKYVPYTPRQRVGSSHVVPPSPSPSPSPSAATGASVHPSPASARGAGEAVAGAGEGTANGKLHMMNLKAAARDIGLDVGSVGWAILEKLVEEGESGQGQSSADWGDVWAALTIGKATLLLPLEYATAAHEKITAEFVKDHIVYCDGSSRNNAPIVTLSGLRGTLTAETLIFRSSLHPSSKYFQNLTPPLTRSSILLSLPPLPVLPSFSPHSPTLFATLSPCSPAAQPTSSHHHPAPASPSYPTYALKSHSPALPLPPAQKPPLPPRPSTTASPVISARPSASPLVPAASSRLALPFVALFGKPSPTTPIIGPAPPGVNAGGGGGTNSSPSLSTDMSRPDGDHIVELSAFTIDRMIVRMDLCREVNKTLREEVQECLQAGLQEDEEQYGVIELPAWVMERVRGFTAGMMPFVESRSKSGNLTNKGVFGMRNKPGVGVGMGEYEVNAALEAPERTSEKFQEFYAALGRDLRADASFFNLGSAEGHDGEALGTEKRMGEGEARVRDVVECVERVVCELFYDRLFLQCSSDDASHDETLSSRVAALNMLDLGLEHLDVQVPEGRGEELDAVVRACGETLSQLDAACRAPADKAAVLVAAHKVVVDGLSRLPPIRLKSEVDADDQKTATVLAKNLSTPIEAAAEDGRESSADGNEDDISVGGPDIDSPPLSPANVPIPMTPSGLVASPTSLGSPHYDALSPTEAAAADAQPKSAALSRSPPLTEATPVSGDILLPMIIFSVVKANPAHLVSHLLFTQRFRNQAVGGEESYCLINLMAVAEFLENVDLEALGLGDSEGRVMSASELTPIPINRSPKTTDSPLLRQEGGLRGRMEQQVDAFTGSANKVISGVVDSSFGVLRLLLPSNPPDPKSPPTDTGNAARPGFGLLRRETGFSIASITASLPRANRPKNAHAAAEETGQPLLVVSRPGSVRSGYGDEDGESGDESADSRDEAGDEANEDEDGEHDTRSIKSFESMMNIKGRDRRGGGARKSLTDRLAHMSGLARLKPEDAALKGSPTSRRSALPASLVTRLDTPASFDHQSPVAARLAPPVQRFMECAEDDIRVSEVCELLREYRRVVHGVKAMGGFEE